MADVKWIKITTDIFDDEKILLIESLPEADSIIVIWFKLLCLAGKQNNSGVFMMNDSIAYTDKMLATIFRRKETTVQLALQTFADFGMIEMIDNVITIPKWGKHQTLDQLEERNQYMKEYMRNYREKQKAISCKSSSKVNGKVNSKVNSKVNVNTLEEDIEEDKEVEVDVDKEKEKKRIDYQLIVDMYNSLCPSLPSVKAISESRKKAIKARLNTYTLDDFKTLFEMAEESNFLRGKNDRNWTATFDWLIKDSNMAKVLDGNYENRKGTSQKPYKNNSKAEELDEFYTMASEWAEGG